MASPRICPACQGEYGPEVATCPLDGRRLVNLLDAEQRLLGRTLDGKYTLQGLLGRGGIGVVFKAWQISMERAVALKVLRRGLLEDETSVRRFLREVQGAGRANHPNIVTAFDFGQTDEGELYLVMELLEGRTLGEILSAERRLSPERVVALLAGICDGLHAAHEAGVVHRDVKPENVLVLPDTGPNGEFVKVVDFGLAQLKSVQGAESITKTGAICGTPAYMSPEQALDRPVDRRTDIYSLGVMAWQLLSGSLPFTGDSPMRLLLAHLHEAPPPLALRAPLVPPGIAAVVMEALAKDPADRPATAAEFKRRLLVAIGAATGPQPRLETRLDPRLDASQPTLDSLPAAAGLLSPTLPSNSLPAVSALTPPSVDGLPPVAPPRRIWPLAVALVVAVGGSMAALMALRDEPSALDAGLPVADARPAMQPDRALDVAMVEATRVDAAPVVDAARLVDAARPDVAIEAAPVSVAAAAINIQSRPTGAEVRADGVILGTTPLSIPRPAQALRLQVRLAGYEMRTLRLDPRRTAPLQVNLRKLPEIVE